MLRLVLVESGVLPGRRRSADLRRPWSSWSSPYRAWAERTRPTNWHPHHIAERYGLFTIILLGESVLAATTGVQAAVRGSGQRSPSCDLGRRVWSCSFAPLVAVLPRARRATAWRSDRDRSYLWGYGHYGIFAALAAVGAGLEVAVEQTGHHLEVSPVAVGYAVAMPVGVFLLLLWAVHAPILPRPVIRPAVILSAALVVLLLPLAVGLVGLAVVVATIALVVALVIAATLLTSSSEASAA